MTDEHLDLALRYWPYIILIVATAIYRYYRSRIKGFFGEQNISSRLSRLDPDRYSVIDNVVVNVNGKTSQIDHLVISDFGLFVIETKNYKGWIMGGEHSQYWTQVLFKRKEKFYNPILQNRGHIAALRHYLQSFTNLEYISIVVFSDSATIKVKTDSLVIYNSQLTQIIRGYAEVRLTALEKEAIFDSIIKANVSGTYKRIAHKNSIKQRILDRDIAIGQGRCPRCGGELIDRKGKFGRFIGCTSYPKCKFTIN